MYVRGSCTISDSLTQTLIIIGGVDARLSSSALNTVMRYSAGGLVERLPSLIYHRKEPACAGYWDTNILVCLLTYLISQSARKIRRK